MNSAIARLIALLPIPAGAAREVAEYCLPIAPDSLAINPATAPYATRLADPVFLKERLASSYDALDAVLNSKDTRAGILTTILDKWILSPKDQVRLAGHRLSPSVADRITTGPFVPQAAALAAARASAPARLRHVVRVGTDDEVYAALIDVENASHTTKRVLPLVAALAERPTLRTRALYSQIPLLVAAACWTEIPLEDQPAAAELAIAQGRAGHGFDPVVGLLNQPSLEISLRGELEEHLDRQAELFLANYAIEHPGWQIPRTIHRKGLGRRNESFLQGAPARECDVPHVLNDIITRASLRTTSNIVTREKALTTPLLIELSHNPHLTLEQMDRVLRVFSIHQEFSPGGLLEDAFTRLVRRRYNDAAPLYQRVAPDVTLPTTIFVDLFITPPSVSRLREVPNSKIARRVFMPDSPLNRVAPLENPSETHLTNALHKYLAPRLGDGTTALSISTWRIFVGLLIDAPLSATMAEVSDAASRLASLDAVPALA